MDKKDTDTIKATTFQPHGRVSFNFIERNIIVYKAIGPFNEELIQALAVIEHDALQEARDTEGCWGEIVVFEKTCAATHEVFQQVTNYLIECKKAGLANTYTAFVFPKDIECTSFLISNYEQCYESAKLPFKAFEEYDDALLWVKSELDKLSC